MSEKRRDSKGRILRTGESQRKDGRYAYKYTDACGKTQFVYAWKLVPTDKTPTGKRDDVSLREKVKEILRDINDGIDTIGKKMTVCQLYARLKTIQTDNGTEFTYKYKLIPPRTPWHNGKVERSHRNDQRYFYDWETFRSVEELNKKLEKHLVWSNNKTMRTLGNKSPIQILAEKLAA